MSFCSSISVTDLKVEILQNKRQTQYSTQMRSWTAFCPWAVTLLKTCMTLWSCVCNCTLTFTLMSQLLSAVLFGHIVLPMQTLGGEKLFFETFYPAAGCIRYFHDPTDVFCLHGKIKCLPGVKPVFKSPQTSQAEKWLNQGKLHQKIITAATSWSKTPQWNEQNAVNTIYRREVDICC